MRGKSVPDDKHVYVGGRGDRDKDVVSDLSESDDGVVEFVSDGRYSPILN